MGEGAYVHVFVSSVQHYLHGNGLGIVLMCNAVCAASAVCISIPSIHCTAMCFLASD
jgi:enoyl-CoA hydratase/carnithine racemase